MYKKILYPILFLFSIWFFFRGIPLDTQDAHSGLLACIGAIIGVVLGLMAVFQLFPLKEKEDSKKYEGDNAGYFIVGGVIVFLIAYGVMYISDVMNRKKREMDTNSGFAMGRVIDGSSVKTRKADFTSLTISYTSEDGKQYTTDMDISADEFSNHYKDEELPIRYSKKYPLMIEIIRDRAAMQKSKVAAMPDLSLNELVKVLNIKTSSATLMHLNVVNEGWSEKEVQATENPVYINYQRHTCIKILGKNKLQYVHHSIDPTLYSSDLKEMGFIPVPNTDKDKTAYKNKDFFVTIAEGVAPEMSSTTPDQRFTILEVIKPEK